jgi:two-component system, chemotaxis family, CheB/CheR fusion protein
MTAPEGDGGDERQELEDSGAAGMEGLEELLRFVRDERGFDFTGYKRSSLGRRVRRRMQEVGVDTVAEYRLFLEESTDEFTALFNTILINVTGFFRDPAAWAFIESEIVPRIVSGLDQKHPIRLWSAGCASGEEAYTLAMVMANALGVSTAARRVKIYGTDVDLEALAHARAGVYPEKALEEVPSSLRAQYFRPDPKGRGFALIPALRRTIVFGRHDLTRDPPISHVALLACRNTLMYFTSEMQAAVVPRLHYALKDDGYLFLGRAEMVVHGGAGRFEPVSVRHRVFMAVPGTPPHTASSPTRLAIREPFDLRPFEALPLERDLVGNGEPESTLKLGPVAQILLSPDGTLTGANSVAQEVLGIQVGDLGRPISAVRLASGSDEVVASVEWVLEHGAIQNVAPVHLVAPSGAAYDLALQAYPLRDDRDRMLGVSVILVDVGKTSALQEDFFQMHTELETAYEELQSTNEELVTSNEELQSSYEELETTNEELQSANEELETTNEELRSSNEELEATNIELKSASDAVERMNTSLVHANNELNRFSALHRHVMDNFPSAVVVLDSHLLIREWNRAATNLWGLREDEVVGEPFFGLDFGLPLETLQEPVRACRSPGAASVTLELEAVNRLGRHVNVRVTVVAATGDDVPPSAMLIMQVVDTNPS